MDVMFFGSWGEQIFRTKLPMTDSLLNTIQTGVLIGACALIISFFIGKKLKRSKSPEISSDVEKTIKELEWYVNHKDEIPDRSDEWCKPDMVNK